MQQTHEENWSMSSQIGGLFTDWQKPTSVSKFFKCMILKECMSMNVWKAQKKKKLKIQSIYRKIRVGSHMMVTSP